MSISIKRILASFVAILACTWGNPVQPERWMRSLPGQQKMTSQVQPRENEIVLDGNQLPPSIKVVGPVQVFEPTLEERELQLLSGFLAEEPAVGFIEFDNQLDDFDSGSEQQWPYAPMTSMTDVAKLFPPHVGPTKLFLNFDGFDSKYVSPFVTTTGDRDRDIQEIMFRVAQTFAPFNVQVKRFYGNGQHAVSNGHTTIFIGDKLGNTFYYESDSGILVDNKKRAYADADYPCPGRGVLHAPNSDDYNMGMVDPISSTVLDGYEVSWDTNDNAAIARSICHEAGHTFGLAHVLSGSTPDVMSYSTINKRATNVEYTITSLNSQVNGPTVENWDIKPMWWFFQITGFGGQTQLAQAPLDTQSSYQCLLATLGPRDTSNDYANIADDSLVSGAYLDSTNETIAKYQLIPSQIGGYGDYDVFDLSPATTEYLQVNVNAMEGDNWFDPIVMIFDSSGNLVEYDDDSGSGKAGKAVFHAVLGQNYKVVVGAQSNNTHGTYQLSVEPPVFQVNPAVGGGIGGLTKNTGGHAGGTAQKVISN